MTVVLLRHGRSTSNTAHILAGRTPGVELDDHGRKQAAAVVDRLVGLDIAEIVRSPLLRCEQTVGPIAADRGLTPVVEERLVEVDYGSGRAAPSRICSRNRCGKSCSGTRRVRVFPDGEGLAQVQARAVAAIREHDRRLAEEHGKDVVWIACTHGDVIKSVLADAYAMHLDSFQRIVAEPASMSVIRYSATSPFVLRVNDTGDALAAIGQAKASTNGSAPEQESVPGGEVGV